MPQTGVPPGGVPQGGAPPNSMSYPGGPGQGQYQHPPPGSHPGPVMGGGQAGPPPVTQPGYQQPPHEFSPYNMQGKLVGGEKYLFYLGFSSLGSVNFHNGFSL